MVVLSLNKGYVHKINITAIAEVAQVDIINVKILKGYFPKRQLKLILAWAEIHKDELMQIWELARNHEALYRIAPLT